MVFLVGIVLFNVDSIIDALRIVSVTNLTMPDSRSVSANPPVFMNSVLPAPASSTPQSILLKNVISHARDSCSQCQAEWSMSHRT